MDFIKTHLDIEPPADWKKEPLERFHNAIGYANRTMGICMMAFPLDDYRQYQLQTDTDWSINFGRTYGSSSLWQKQRGTYSAIEKIPLQEHVSFYIIVRQCGRLPKPLRTRSVCSRLLPLLRAFKRFWYSTPDTMRSRRLQAPGRELLNRYYSNARSWRIALPPGWSEKSGGRWRNWPG